MQAEQQLVLQPQEGAVQEGDPSAGSIYFIGNATVIIRYAGFTILTAFVFGPDGSCLAHTSSWEEELLVYENAVEDDKRQEQAGIAAKA